MTDDDKAERARPTARRGAFAPPSIDLLAVINKKLEAFAGLDLEEELSTWVNDWYEVAEHTPASEHMAGRAVAFMLRAPLLELADEICRAEGDLRMRRKLCHSDETFTRVAELVATDADVAYYVKTECRSAGCFVPAAQTEEMAQAWHRGLLEEVLHVLEYHIDDTTAGLLSVGTARGASDE